MITYAAAIAVGALGGMLVWLVSGQDAASLARVESVQARLAAIRPVVPHSEARNETSVQQLRSNPIFALTTGPGAVSEPYVRLEGISVTRRRAAALLSIGSDPADWLRVGESRHGVTLQQVAGSRVILETPLGVKELGLGQASGSPGSTMEGTASSSDQAPAGFRSPPPPASAPVGDA